MSKEQSLRELELVIDLIHHYKPGDRLILELGRFPEVLKRIERAIQESNRQAAVQAMQDYLETGEWIRTDHLGYVTMRGVFESRIDKLRALKDHQGGDDEKSA